MVTLNHTTTLEQTRPIHPKAAFDLRSPGLLGRWPMIGIAMLLLGGLLFAGFALDLNHGPLLPLDNHLAKTLPPMALKGPSFLKPLMDSGFYIGDQVVMVLALLLGIYFIFRRHWQELAMMFFSLLGSTFFFLSLSTIIGRARPPDQIWIIVKMPGFPSGHAIEVVVFYGLMAYLLASKIRSVFWKSVVVAAALLIMGFVGFTRVFTGGHYLTDILAGYAVGLAWSGLIFTLIETMVQNRRRRHEQQV